MMSMAHTFSEHTNFLLYYTIINDGIHREWVNKCESERKSSMKATSSSCNIKHGMCLYFGIYKKKKKKSSSYSLDSTRCKSHLHLLIPSRKPFHRQPVRNKWRVSERERDGKWWWWWKATGFSLWMYIRMLYTTTSSLSLFFVIIMNGVAAWITE